MKSLTKICCSLLICLGLLAGSMATMLAQNQTDHLKVVGIWQGALKVPGVELRIVFKISQQENGALAAVIDSPDQGATDIPVSDVVFKNDSLRIESSLIRGVYKGQIQLDNNTIVGVWNQGGMNFPLELQRIDAVPKLNRPQEPKPPYPYLEEEVTVLNASAAIELAGTFTRPTSGEPFSAVILITGSGPQDRDETVFSHRPFLVLADHLTRQGIAVLRMDDRGVGKSTGNFATATSEDFARDVIAGIEYLKTRTDVRSDQIGLIGHSEGGMIAPMVAAQSGTVAFIVLLAGTGLTGEEILYLQTELITRANGASESTIEKNREAQQRMFAVVKQEQDDSVATAMLETVLNDAVDQLSEEERNALGDKETHLNAQIKRVLSPWFRCFLTYDPIPTLMKVKCPVLAINGELDLQVPPKENLGAIEKALKASGNTKYTIKEFPKLNHLFQTAVTGSPTEYAKIEETMSPDVLKFVADWILELLVKK